MTEVLYKNLELVTAAQQVAQTLKDYLERGTVLLSLSGGSAISMQIDLLKNIDSQGRLTLTLNDERYGLEGHANSNWQQLRLAGLDNLNIDSQPVLSGLSANETSQEFNKFLNSARNSFDFLVTILGMGEDGHTSGILPNSPATTSSEMCVYYEAPDYKRLTNTFNFLKIQDEAFVFAYGTAKHDQINLLDKDISPKVQPIQIIKQMQRVTFYNDLNGESK